MRIEHINNVKELIKETCIHYNIDEKKYIIAAEYHDICRNWKIKELIEYSKKINDIPKFYKNNPVLLHAPVGAYLAEKDGINNKEILDAIKFHPTGKLYYSNILKFLMIADFSEKNRKFKEASIVRDLIFKDIDKAFFMCIKFKIIFCLKQDQQVYEDTIKIYNELFY